MSLVDARGSEGEIGAPTGSYLFAFISKAAQSIETYVRRVNIALNDIQDRNIASRLVWYCRDHPVFRL